MADIQSKLGEGLSRFQGGVEKGKQRIQLTQEMSRLKRELAEATSEKSRLYVEMGMRAHQLVRDGGLFDQQVSDFADALLACDKSIYRIQRQIAELSDVESEGMTCECGASLQSGDKFCGECGAKVMVFSVQEEQAFVACHQCEEQVAESANFCGCCGYKLTS
nr:zinc ribbon domain-containing protein [Texcoconibacillus texcoconensis]